MQLSRRDLLKASAVGAGGLALSSLPTEAFARVAPGHCGWGAFAEPGRGQSIMQAVFQMERLIGRKLDLTRHYMSWDRPIPNEQVRLSAKTGHIPLVSWETQRRNKTYVKWADIAAGRHDEHIKDNARAIKKWGRRMYLVFNHEPENDTGCGNASQFRAAFNHTRHVFENVGAHNVRWVCTLMRTTYTGGHGGAKAWVPSAAQAVGVDGYNRGRCNPDVGWESFGSIFAPARFYARNHHKKLVIQEWGCVERTACSGNYNSTKAEWLRAAGKRIKDWHEIEAVIYTHARCDFEGKEFSYRVDSSPAALDAYRDYGRQTYFH